MQTVSIKNILTNTTGTQHGVARVQGQTHVVVKTSKDVWAVSFTHLSGCACNYCNGMYDHMINKVN